MASPVDTFKNSLFGQLKSYSNAVQGAFEQRIARPLLAFKRDLSRPTSETRNPNEQEILSTHRVRQESTSSSSPLEIIDIDTSGSFKSIFDKVKNTLSPSTKRRTSENPVNNERKNSNKDANHQQQTSSLTNTKKPSKSRLHHHKSVSFAENNDNDTDSDINVQYSIDDKSEIIRNAHTLADKILIESIDEATIRTKLTNHSTNQSNTDIDDEEFQRDFHRTIKPRRIFNDNKEDLIYQDLSAEIVAYILKHALRTLKKEQQQQLILSTKTEEDDDFIDLK